MYVKHHMSSPALTITPDTPFQDALRLMHERKIRRLPVVDRNGKLVGIVSERDLLHAAPSPATSLSVWELNYLLWKLTVKDLMATKVLTVTPDALLQEAATIMLEKKNRRLARGRSRPKGGRCDHRNRYFQSPRRHAGNGTVDLCMKGNPTWHAKQ